MCVDKTTSDVYQGTAICSCTAESVGAVGHRQEQGKLEEAADFYKAKETAVPLSFCRWKLLNFHLLKNMGVAIKTWY